MALFGLKQKTSRARMQSSALAPISPSAEENHFESVRLVGGEATPRVNVPAIAQNGARRMNLSLPTTQHSAPMYDAHTAERRLIVGRDISLAGEISECDHLVVDGTIEATLGHGKRLLISGSGLFHGKANVEEADIAGRYEGELNAVRLRLRAGSQFTGRLRFSLLEVEAGAQITGEFEYIPLPDSEPEAEPVLNFPAYQAARRA